jgi:hypothetical protein
MPAARKLSTTVTHPFTFTAELSPTVRRPVILHAVPAAAQPELPAMSNPDSTKPVERLFPFVLRARILLVGRETLFHSKSRLHFVLVTEDVAEGIRAEVLAGFTHYPVVQHFTAADLERFFGIKGAKVIGFAKSGLAQSIYAELKAHRINQPVTKPKPPEPPENSPGRRS